MLKGRITAPVNLDTLEMGENADSMVTFYFKENSILISFVFKNKSAVALSSVSFNFLELRRARKLRRERCK